MVIKSLLIEASAYIQARGYQKETMYQSIISFGGKKTKTNKKEV